MQKIEFSRAELFQINFIRKAVPAPARYEQLAEECTELAQAALKVARHIRGENPTPKDPAQIFCDFLEEVSDVILCLDCVNMNPDLLSMERKLNRWYKRICEKQQEELKKENESSVTTDKEKCGSCTGDCKHRAGSSNNVGNFDLQERS